MTPSSSLPATQRGLVLTVSLRARAHRRSPPAPQPFPLQGLNNSQTCSQANQTPSCLYEDAFFVERLISAIAAHDPALPFFGIFAPHSVHGPLQVPDAYLQQFDFINSTARRFYAAMVRYIDDQLALVVAALRARGMWDNLLFVLQADNGECARARARSARALTRAHAHA